MKTDPIQKTNQIPKTHHLSGFLFSLLLPLSFVNNSFEPLFAQNALLQIFIIFILSFVLAKRNISTKAQFFPLIFFGTLLTSAFIWSLLFSTFSNETLLSAQRALLIYTPTLAMFVAIWMSKNPRAFFYTVITCLLWAFSLTCLVAVFVYAFGSVAAASPYAIQSLTILGFTFEQTVMGIPPLYRTGGFLGNPNRLAIGVIFFTPFLFFIHSEKKIGNISFFSFFCIFIGAILITFSRTGIIIFLFQIFLLTFFRRKAWRMFSILGFCIATVLAAVLLKDFSGSERLSMDLNMRDFFWQTGWASFLETNGFGVGFGVSGEILLLSGNASQLSMHNTYLEWLVELGAPGLLFILALIFMPIQHSLAHFFKSKKFRYHRYQSAVFVIFFFSVAVSALAESIIFRFSIFHSFFILIAAISLHPAMWFHGSLHGFRALEENRFSNRHSYKLRYTAREPVIPRSLTIDRTKSERANFVTESAHRRSSSNTTL